MLYRRSYKPGWSEFFLSPPGVLSILASALWLVATVVLFICIRRMLVRSPYGRFHGVILPFMACCVGMACFEIVLRVLTIQQWWGEELQGRLLLPRGWNQVVSRYVAMLDRLETTRGYFASDPFLGWTVGKSRSDRSGLWVSSQDGIRSKDPNDQFYLDGEWPCRIALLGDSFTFGWEESFEQTMGFFLQQRLGADCQVLNLAVPGYSLSQMALRYEREVSHWHPTLIVVSFTDGAPSRGMGVYCFLMMGDWDCPWAAPRYAVQDHGLALVNVPLPSPREIYAQKAIYELPFIRYDQYYVAGEWEQAGWQLAYASYFFRWVTTLYPLHSLSRPEVGDAAMTEMNQLVLKQLVNQARNHATPLIFLYQPKKEDYSAPKSLPYSVGLLQSLDLPFVDGRQCLESLPQERRFRAGGTHYSDDGEAAMAACLFSYIEHGAPARRASL